MGTFQPLVINSVHMWCRLPSKFQANKKKRKVSKKDMDALQAVPGIEGSKVPPSITTVMTKLWILYVTMGPLASKLLRCLHHGVHASARTSHHRVSLHHHQCLHHNSRFNNNNSRSSSSQRSTWSRLFQFHSEVVTVTVE